MMNSLGSHPGAILFRLSIMVILIVILISIFFTYLEDTEKTLEQTSILQTKKVIDSALAVVFSTYAVNLRLEDLNELDGANPFVFLSEYGIVPGSYVGEVDQDLSVGDAPGWYYLKHRGLVVYLARFSESDHYFSVKLDYEDHNQSGRFEPGADQFKNLSFVKLLTL